MTQCESALPLESQAVSAKRIGYSPNLLIDAPPPDGISQLWVGDITYVPLVGGDFLCLAMLMDRFSRRIVGWDLQDHMREALAIAALRAAVRARRPEPGLIHHTDRGGQYAGADYRKLLARAAMAQSMSRAADCYDNAFMESCFGTIKTELEMKPYKNPYIARNEVPAPLLSEPQEEITTRQEHTPCRESTSTSYALKSPWSQSCTNSAFSPPADLEGNCTDRAPFRIQSLQAAERSR